MKNTENNIIKTHVSTKYQVVIPKAIRNQVDIQPQDEFIVFATDPDTIVLKKKIPSVSDLFNSLPFHKDYLKNERTSW